jgi:hypothetical protein
MDMRSPILLRIPASLKASLVESARANRRSLTAEAQVALERYVMPAPTALQHEAQQ